MPLWLTPVLIEFCALALFFAVLLGFRRSLGARSLVFWGFVWLLQVATCLIALRSSALSDRFILFYAPLQLALALALVGIALRLENQKDRLRGLQEQVKELSAEAASRLELDPLTELWNRSALDRWMEEEQDFRGMIVVCDLDDFKALNDMLGHLVGDEILRDIGQLVRTSIRHEDRAFRWGGDEFVICFRTQDRALVEDRLRTLEKRLQHFHIRNHGPVAVRFSWGAAEVTPGRPVREAVDEADRLMYEFKRQRRVSIPSPGSEEPGVPL